MREILQPGGDNVHATRMAVAYDIVQKSQPTGSNLDWRETARKVGEACRIIWHAEEGKELPPATE